MANKTKVTEDKVSNNRSKGLLAPPRPITRIESEEIHTTQDAMDELLDETFNSDSLDDAHSLVGLDDVSEDSTGDAPVLAGPTSPEANAKRYRSFREDQSFWDEVDRLDDGT